MSIGFKRRLAQKGGRIAGVGLAMALAATPAAAGDPFYERTVVLAADARCGLFTPPVTGALKAAQAQARGAALRRGETAQALAATEARARARGRGAACGSADLQRVKARVESAFAGWSRTLRMDFDGWRADRAGTGWGLSQTSRTGASPVTFGVADGEATAVVSFVGRPRPYAARLVMRDADATSRAWLSGEPPASLRATFLAGGWRAADTPLLSTGARSGEAWRFGPEALEGLSRLDPRERFTVEFLFRDDSVARASFQVGDVAAARAFLALG